MRAWKGKVGMCAGVWQTYPHSHASAENRKKGTSQHTQERYGARLLKNSGLEHKVPCVPQTLASTRTWVEARQVPPVSRILEKWWKVDGGGGGGGERRWRWRRGRRPYSYDLGGTLHKCRNYMFNRGKQKEQRSVSRLQNESFCKPFSVNPFQKAPFSFGFSLKSLKIQSANSSKGHATPPATATTKLHPQRRQCAVS